MAESFPGAPGASGGSFPHGPDPDDATASESDTLLFRRYRVRRELGRGGMGVVLLAHDTALDIDVAVKLLPDLMVKDTEAIADLRKEVLRGMALAHPGIVRTHNFEKDQSDAGIVMEFIDGESLTELKLKQAGKCFEPEEILPWIEQLCAVLDYAHFEAHIVHRDLKPRNIMLTRAGRVKVADFGIAAVVSDSMSRHSMEGVVSGTLSYMSPQQAAGKRPSHLDDIYALGATIYELLTGKPPFFRGNPASIHAQILSIVPPKLMEQRDDLEVKGRAPIPSAWEETIAACLAKDAEQRPQSAGDVITRLKIPDPPKREPTDAEPSMPPSLRRILEENSFSDDDNTGTRTFDPLLPSGPARSPFRAAIAIVVLGALGTGVWFGMHDDFDIQPADGSSADPPQIAGSENLNPSPGGSFVPDDFNPPPAAPQTRQEELVQQGRALRQRGDLTSALIRFKEASALDPANAETIAEIAMTFEKMNVLDQAALHWKLIYDMGDAAGSYFIPAESRLKMSQAQELASAQIAAAGSAGPISRLRPDATLGLGEIDREDRPAEGALLRFALRVPIRAKAGASVNVQDVDIHVLFYDQLDTKTVVQTSADVHYKWASSPVDWSAADVEVLEVEYDAPVPLGKGPKAEERDYFGYVVRIYYQGELQDTRAEPETLNAKFPAPQFLEKLEPSK